MGDHKAIVSIAISAKRLCLFLGGFHICQCFTDSWSQIDAAFAAFRFGGLQDKNSYRRRFFQ